MSIVMTNIKLHKKTQTRSQSLFLSRTKKRLLVCSLVTLVPLLFAQQSFADINLFQKKPVQNEATKEEVSSQNSPLQATLNGEAALAEGADQSIADTPEGSAQKAVVPMGRLEKQAQSAVATTMQTSHFPKILVVDVQGVLLSSAVGKDIKKQFDDKQAAFMKEIEVEEGELKKTEQDLLRQRTVLSQEVFAKKKAEFDERMVALNTKFQKNRQILEEAFNLARTDVESKLIEVIKEVKIEQSANLVLPAQQVIMGDDQMDVTNEVLSRFNKKVPSYKVNF